MTYNDVYTRLSLLTDIAGVKLSAKAKTEVLILKTVYSRPMREFEAIRNDVAEEPDEEARIKALEARASEDCGVAERKLSESTFESIVEALASEPTIATSLHRDGDGNPAAVPTEEWLSMLADLMVV